MTPLMLTASTIAACLALIWAAVLVWLAIGAVLRRRQLHAEFQALPRPSVAGRRVLIIRPCAGEEPGLYANLLSIAELSSGAMLRIILSVDSHEDRARPITEAAAAQLRARGLDVRAEVHAPLGPNRKASMLAEVVREHGPGHELVVNIDSNVDLTGFDLDALLGSVLARDRVGVVWAPWVEERQYPGLGPRASEAVLGGSLAAFPLLCGLHPGALVGKIWAARLEALAASGDLRELARYLGEDMAMADRLRAAGWSITAASTLGRARGGQPSFEQTVDRFARWLLVVRAQEPQLLLSYPLFFFATPLVSALALLGCVASPKLAATALCLATGARLLITIAARYWSGRGMRTPAIVVDVVLSDLVLMLAWIRAISRREVEWRGHRLRVEPSGQLSSLE